MESNRNQTITYPQDAFEFANVVGERDDVETRLNALLKANQQTILENEYFRNEEERFEASILRNPLTTKQVFAQFGLMLGLFPPAAIFGKFAYENILRNPYNDDNWIILLMIFVNIVCTVTGYFSGKLIGNMVSQVEKLSWGKMLLILPFIGILWGIMTGGAGGLFIFVIGAFFGAMIASMVGGLALPVFTIFHRLLKKGDFIERDLFLPIALGVTLIISALILGLK